MKIQNWRIESSYSKDVTSRLLATVFSVITFFLLAQNLGLERFAVLQVALSFVGFAILFGDLGIGVHLLDLDSQKKHNQVREAWTLRLLGILIASGMIGFVSNLYFDYFNWFFFIGAFFESLNNSNLTFRQVTSNSKVRIFAQPMKTSIQCITLSILSFFGVRLADYGIMILLGVPALLLYLWDTKLIGGFSKSVDLSHYRYSWRYFVNAGGNSLLNLDYLIISQSGNLILVSYMSIVRKMLNTISTFALALSARLQHEIFQSKRVSSESLRRLVIVLFINAVALAAILILLEPLINRISNEPISEDFPAVGLVIIITGWFQVSSLILNSMLMASRRYFYATVSTYVGTVTYVGSLYFNPFNLDIISQVVFSLVMGIGLRFLIDFTLTLRYVDQGK